MDPQQVMAQGREMLLKELGLHHLSVEAQEVILEEVGSVLFERVLLKIISLLPESERDNFGTSFAAHNVADMQTLVERHIPNSSEVVRQELRAGIEEHKRIVAEELSKAT